MALACELYISLHLQMIQKVWIFRVLESRKNSSFNWKPVPLPTLGKKPVLLPRGWQCRQHPVSLRCTLHPWARAHTHAHTHTAVAVGVWSGNSLNI